MADKTEKERYLANPRLCPKCQSSDIEVLGDYHGEGDFGDPKHLWNTMICNNCDAYWFDHFTLTGITFPEEEENVE